MMAERLLIVLLLLALGCTAYRAFKWLHLRRLQRPTAAAGPTAADATPEPPTLLYFRSATCAVCPTQGRYIDQVAQQWSGRLAIRTVDAEAEPETAARYGVFTLPTTIIVGQDGHVREINYGLTNAQKLERQLHAVLVAA